MDIHVVHLLAEAGAAIEAAQELTEAGSPEWSHMLKAIKDIEQMVTYEVTATWPEPDAPAAAAPPNILGEMVMPSSPTWGGYTARFFDKDGKLAQPFHDEEGHLPISLPVIANAAGAWPTIYLPEGIYTVQVTNMAGDVVRKSRHGAQIVPF